MAAQTDAVIQLEIALTMYLYWLQIVILCCFKYESYFDIFHGTVNVLYATLIYHYLSIVRNGVTALYIYVLTMFDPPPPPEKYEILNLNLSDIWVFYGILPNCTITSHFQRNKIIL